MNVRYRVELSQTERTELTELLSGGKHAARRLKRAQILLAANGGASDEAIATNVGVGSSTVYRTKRRFVLGNLEAALSEEPRPGANRKLSGKEEALLVATACSSPPAGRARWTLELLSGELVRLTAHESVSRETVRRRLTENALKPWRKDMWCIPQVDADYVARMEDVLDLYSDDLTDVHYPEAERIRVVLDNLSTHSAGALYQTFPADEARRVLRRLEFHYVPKHASWLNMVEIEIGVLASQCLDRRIESYTRLVAETAAWEKRRNAECARINWMFRMFTTQKARAKMGRSYPKPTLKSDQKSKSQNLCDEVLERFPAGLNRLVVGVPNALKM